MSHCHNIVGTGVPSLQALNGTLTDLDMGGCTRIQDSSLNAICRIGTLTSLTLEGCRNLTNVAIQVEVSLLC